MNEQNLVLLERNEPIEWFASAILTLCFVLILWTKSIRPQAFLTTFILFRGQVSFDATLKEAWPIAGLHSWLLNINFILNLGLSIFLYVNTKTEVRILGDFPELSFPLALLFFLLAFVTLTFIGTITGSKKVFGRPMQLTWILPQFIGLILFLFNLVWILNPEIDLYLMWMVFGLIILLSMQRIFRSTTYLLGAQVDWYYILLYLCTLEITPLLLLVWFLFDWTN